MAVYSFSQLQSFVTCELRDAYQYVLKYDVPKTPSLPLILGSTVHDTLEWLYKRISFKTVPTLEEVMAQYEACWDNEME